MLISADLKCYYCGFVSGEVIADTAHPERILAFKPTAAAAADGTANARRCGRCRGPVFLDEAQTLSPREAAALISAARARSAAATARAGA